MTETTKPEAGFLFQYTSDLGDGTNLSVSGNWPKGATPGEMNPTVDAIKTVFMRLRAQHEVPLIKDRIAGTQGQLAQLEIDYAEHMRKHEKARDAKMTARMEMGIADLKVNIAKGEIALLETIEKAK